MKSYTLQQIQQMLTEPSFPFENYVPENHQLEPSDFIVILEYAIAHHEMLDKDNNAENQ